MIVRISEWPSTYVSIHGSSKLRCSGRRKAGSIYRVFHGNWHEKNDIYQYLSFFLEFISSRMISLIFFLILPIYGLCQFFHVAYRETPCMGKVRWTVQFELMQQLLHVAYPRGICISHAIRPTCAFIPTCRFMTTCIVAHVNPTNAFTFKCRCTVPQHANTPRLQSRRWSTLTTIIFSFRSLEFMKWRREQYFNNHISPSSCAVSDSLSSYRILFE